ncbi:transcriptional regulator [Natronomonas gomsonensis]|uniref:RAD55 family ATPase n=1 Tax=Natronomonas gomsonensis TaxID=1046043 RepID=UPI0015B908CC|nr:transcriptional regulator [Natronomonas gomsonensis]
MANTMGRQFSTGLPFLDRAIGGGIPAGDLLALTAAPATQSELFLKQFTAAHRTHYVSLLRSEAEVREWLPPTVDAESVTVTTATPAELLETPETVTEGLRPASFLIVDTVDGLEEATREEYLAFLDHLKSTVRETDSVGVLHGTGQETTPPRRDLTLARADTVWRLQMLVLSRQIKSQLLVTKSRNGRALTEPIDLVMTDQVRIDTSRRIS